MPPSPSSEVNQTQSPSPLRTSFGSCTVCERHRVKQRIRKKKSAISLNTNVDVPLNRIKVPFIVPLNHIKVHSFTNL